MKKFLIIASCIFCIKGFSQTLSTVPELQTEAQKKLDVVVAEKNKNSKVEQ